MSEKRMLLIDDELGFREFVGKVATSAGYEVELTSNAKDFMGLYENFDPTLIVMDMIIPEMDGFELMQWLIAQKCRARVLVVTGYNPHVSVRSGRGMGAVKRISYVEARPHKVLSFCW